MPADAIGEGLGMLFCVGLDASTTSKKGEPNWGCIVVIIVLIIAGVLLYTVSGDEVDTKKNQSGVIINKLDNNVVLVRGSDGDKIHTISKELYNNKKVNDSIIIIK